MGERCRPARGLSATYRRDEYLVSILDEEASFLATHSMMLSRIKAPISALIKGGLAAIEGLEGYLSREVVERLRKYGWRRLCKNVVVPMAALWGTVLVPLHPCACK